MSRILIVDDDADARTVLSRLVAGRGREVVAVADPDAALGAAEAAPFDVVLTDLDLRAPLSGVDLLRAMKQANPRGQVILITGYGSLDTAVQALRLGAFEYICKPWDPEELRRLVDRALDASRAPEIEAPLHARQLPPGLVGRSAGMLAVYKQIALAADTSSPVLITGESGTGKELVARAVHEYGARRHRPFVAINCGAVTESLFESELFGHLRGSFTGAVADAKGVFEQAQGGTVFLDEIGETPAAMQVKLLRVLQEREIRPVGARRTVVVDARVIAATNRDLEREVNEGRFRQDLYYRLGVLTIRLPPLRERRDDIPLLVDRFVANASAKAGRGVAMAPEAMAVLASYPWRGNVRELEHTLEHLVVRDRSGCIRAEDVTAVLDPVAPDAAEGLAAGMPTLDELSRRYMLLVLQATGGNKTRAAAMLGIDRRTLYRMAARFGIPLREDEAV